MDVLRRLSSLLTLVAVFTVLVDTQNITPSSPCPANRQTIYRTASGDPYLLLCDTDFIAGEDLDVTKEVNLAACLARCSRYNRETPGTSCLGANYRLDNNQCYLKGNTDGRFDDSNVQSGLLVFLSETATPRTTSVVERPDFDTVAAKSQPLQLPNYPANRSVSANIPILPSNGGAPVTATSNVVGSLPQAEEGGDSRTAPSAAGHIPKAQTVAASPSPKPFLSVRNVSYVSIGANASFDINIYQINVKKVLSKQVLGLFNRVSINYFSQDEHFFYAKSCHECAIHRVFKDNGTYAAAACPTCPPRFYQYPGLVSFRHLSNPHEHGIKHSIAGSCSYENPTLIQLETTSTPLTSTRLTTINIACSTCLAGKEAVACPAASVTAIRSLEKAYGPMAARSAAAQYLAAATAGPKVAVILAPGQRRTNPKEPFSPSDDSLFNGTVAPSAGLSFSNMTNATSFASEARPLDTGVRPIMISGFLILGTIML